LHVEKSGRVVRGLALPFHEEAIVEGPKGAGIVAEVMDEKSIGKIEPNLPLLVNQDRGRVAGVVRTLAVTNQGLGIEAKLVGSDDELEGWARRFRHGLLAALSVGFSRDRRRDAYERPRRPGELPTVRPRGISIVEVSLVQWGAYALACRCAARAPRICMSKRRRPSPGPLPDTQSVEAEVRDMGARPSGPR
jgi:phage head maturation protease